MDSHQTISSKLIRLWTRLKSSSVELSLSLTTRNLSVTSRKVSSKEANLMRSLSSKCQSHKVSHRLARLPTSKQLRSSPTTKTISGVVTLRLSPSMRQSAKNLVSNKSQSATNSIPNLSTFPSIALRFLKWLDTIFSFQHCLREANSQKRQHRRKKSDLKSSKENS